LRPRLPALSRQAVHHQPKFTPKRRVTILTPFASCLSLSGFAVPSSRFACPCPRPPATMGAENLCPAKRKYTPRRCHPHRRPPSGATPRPADPRPQAPNRRIGFVSSDSAVPPRPVSHRLPSRVRFVTFAHHHRPAPNRRIGFVSSNSAVPLTPTRSPAPAPGSFRRVSRRRTGQRYGIRENVLPESRILYPVSFQQLAKILVTLPLSVLIIVNGFRIREVPQ